jgi:hypothetical protein
VVTILDCCPLENSHFMSRTIQCYCVEKTILKILIFLKQKNMNIPKNNVHSSCVWKLMKRLTITRGSWQLVLFIWITFRDSWTILLLNNIWHIISFPTEASVNCSGDHLGLLSLRKFTLYVKDNPMIALGYISLVVSVKTINESFSHWSQTMSIPVVKNLWLFRLLCWEDNSQNPYFFKTKNMNILKNNVHSSWVWKLMKRFTCRIINPKENSHFM